MEVLHYYSNVFCMVDHPNVLCMSEESVSWGAFRIIRAARFLKFLEIF